MTIEQVIPHGQYMTIHTRCQGLGSTLVARTDPLYLSALSRFTCISKVNVQWMHPERVWVRFSWALKKSIQCWCDVSRLVRMSCCKLHLPLFGKRQKKEISWSISNTTQAKFSRPALLLFDHPEAWKHGDVIFMDFQQNEKSSKLSYAFKVLSSSSCFRILPKVSSPFLHASKFSLNMAGPAPRKQKCEDAPEANLAGSSYNILIHFGLGHETVSLCSNSLHMLQIFW